MANYLAKGTLLKIADSGGTVYTTIAQLSGDIVFPESQGADIDTTDHNTSGYLRTKTAGLDDMQAFNVDVIWDPSDTSHALLKTLQLSKDKRYMKVAAASVVSPAYVETFQGQIKSFNRRGGIADIYRGTVSILPNTVPTSGTS
jgi:predicted secreted protein